PKSKVVALQVALKWVGRQEPGEVDQKRVQAGYQNDRSMWKAARYLDQPQPPQVPRKKIPAASIPDASRLFPNHRGWSCASLVCAIRKRSDAGREEAE